MKYIFRGIVVFEYNPITKTVTEHNDQSLNGGNFNVCKMVPADYELLSKFFAIAHYNAIGYDVPLDDINVN